jgi:3-mercaptopyruvate sulfurtransferase SseA
VAQTLLDSGWADARALSGGFDAWRRAGYPMEPKGEHRERELSLKAAGKNLRDSEGSSS